MNTTTANMIDSTGELLRTQTGAIHEQAASSTIPLETLQRAFQNIYDTMDQIDRFKLEALGNMKQTVETLVVRGRTSRRAISRAPRAWRRTSSKTPARRRSRRSRDQEDRMTERFDAVIARADRVMARSTSATAPSARPPSASGSGSTRDLGRRFAGSGSRWR